MKKYRVRMTRIVSEIEQAFVTVEATSEEEAMERAQDVAEEIEVNWQWKDTIAVDDHLEAHEAYEV